MARTSQRSGISGFARRVWSENSSSTNSSPLPSRFTVRQRLLLLARVIQWRLVLVLDRREAPHGEELAVDDAERVVGKLGPQLFSHGRLADGVGAEPRRGEQVRAQRH